jgi:hypothetical protein
MSRLHQDFTLRRQTKPVTSGALFKTGNQIKSRTNVTTKGLYIKVKQQKADIYSTGEQTPVVKTIIKSGPDTCEETLVNVILNGFD